jgi:uncharacterized protein (UPF0335 family)
MQQPTGIVYESLAERLNRFIQRVENLEEEKAAIAAAMKDLYQEAKSEGVDVRALKELLKLRKLEGTDRQEHQSTLQQYMQALGMHMSN